jgi:hypothetical protein
MNDRKTGLKKIKNVFKNDLKLLWILFWIRVLSQDSFFSMSIKFTIAWSVIILFQTNGLLPLWEAEKIYEIKHCASWSEMPLNNGNTSKELTLK